MTKRPIVNGHFTLVLHFVCLCVFVLCAWCWSCLCQWCIAEDHIQWHTAPVWPKFILPLCHCEVCVRCQPASPILLSFDVLPWSELWACHWVCTVREGSHDTQERPWLWFFWKKTLDYSLKWTWLLSYYGVVRPLVGYHPTKATNISPNQQLF